MSLLMSESLKQRVSEKNLEKQMSDSVLSEDINKTKIKTIKRERDIILITLESDIQLLDKLYDFSIGMVNSVSLNSQDLNMRTEREISFNVLSCEIDYSSSNKIIKLVLEVDN